MHDNIGTDKLAADNGKFILLCIVSVSEITKLLNYIIPRQIAFNKHVLKDCLSTAASVGTIKSELSYRYRP